MALNGNAARASDFGLQHFAVYVDDFDSAIAAFTAAGGEMFTAPKPLSFPDEQGEGNALLWSNPWGSIVELISRPTPMPYEKPRIYAAGNPEFYFCATGDVIFNSGRI